MSNLKKMSTLSFGNTTYEIVDEQGRKKYESEGENSFATNDSSIAIAPYSDALGLYNQAGSKAFTILGVDKTNSTYTLDSIQGLEVGDVYSVHVYYSDDTSSQGENYGVITAINGDVITVDKLFCERTFMSKDSYLDQDGLDNEQNTFRIMLKPNIGTRIVGCYAHAEGIRTYALLKGAHAEGKDAIANGSFSHSEGNGTQANYAAHAEGFGTKALGHESHAEGYKTEAVGHNSHAEGNGTYTFGEASHAEGHDTCAYRNYSHAEGQKTRADGFCAHAEGDSVTAYGTNSHAEGSSSNLLNEINTAGASINEDNIFSLWEDKKFSIAYGKASHVEGIDCIAIGERSHAEGYRTKAIGNYAHSEGGSTVASGKTSHTEGSNTQAKGENSHAEGSGSKSIGTNSHAEGKDAIANGYGSHTEGRGTIASRNHSHAQGSWNIEDTDKKYIHIVGGGTSATKPANFHTIDGTTGDAWYQGKIESNGEDYAEYFEWQDGNPDNEDRVGLLVTLDGEQIKLANWGDEILGIISRTVAVLGGTYECEWNGKYLTDDFGRIIYEDVEEFDEVIVGNDAEGNPIIEKQSLGFFKHPKLNPNYDPTKKYINRADRPEWDTVGMLGKLYVRDDGTCQVNGYAAVGENGIATSSSEKTNMRVLSRVNENVVRVLLK